LAQTALEFSANARDVHFLHSLGRRDVGGAAALHDIVVPNTLAVVLGQAVPPLQGELTMCHRPRSANSESF
jgi:hypothetical protein